MKTVIMFWLFLILGYFATSIISKIAYTIVDIPLGVPLAKLGIIGAAVQISFIILPFIIAPILTGWVYYRKFRRLPAKRETLNLTIAIACSMVALTIIGWIGTGAWFALIQANIVVILLVLVAPPIIMTILFRVFFPTTIGVLARRDGQ